MAEVTPAGAPGEAREPPVTLLVVVVAFAAAVLGYLLGAAGLPGNLAAGGDPEQAATDPTAPSGPNAPTLGELVPGFEGTLVMIEPGFYRAGRVARWSSDSTAPVMDAMPPSAWAAPNSSGSVLLAALGPSAEAPDVPTALLVGPPGLLRPAVVDVRHFAWHGVDPRALAWVQGTEDATVDVIRTGELDGVGALTISDVGIDIPRRHTLISWGSWGFLILTRPEFGAYALDPSGARIWSYPHVWWQLSVMGREEAGVSASGEILLRDPVERDLAAAAVRDVAVRRRLDWAPRDVHAAAWAPYGDRIALFRSFGEHGGGTLEVWGPDDSKEVSFDVPRMMWSLGWSPDARFLVGRLSGGATIAFFDTADGRVHLVTHGFPEARSVFLR